MEIFCHLLKLGGDEHDSLSFVARISGIDGISSRRARIVIDVDPYSVGDPPIRLCIRLTQSHGLSPRGKTERVFTNASARSPDATLSTTSWFCSRVRLVRSFASSTIGTIHAGRNAR
jgi:hypothetical protein